MNNKNDFFAIFYRYVFFFLIIIQFLWGIYKHIFVASMPVEIFAVRITIILGACFFIYGTYQKRWFEKWGNLIILIFCYGVACQQFFHLLGDPHNPMTQNITFLSLTMITLFVPSKKALISFIISINIAILFIPQENFYLLMNVISFTMFSGLFKYFLLILIDKLESTFNQLNKEMKMSTLGEFANGVSHEINNQITKVSLLGQYIQVLVQDLKNEKLNNKIDELLKESHKVSDIISDIAQLSTKKEMQKEVVNMNQYINQYNKIMKDLIGKQKTTQFSNAIDKSSLYRINKDFFDKVILNLIKNAAEELKKYKDGEFIFNEYERDNNLYLKFSNTGQIPSENLPKIFDSFFTTKPIHESKGIGLSLSSKIIREHQGKLYLKKYKKKDDLTSFVICIPKS